MMRKFSLLALFSLTAGCVAEPGASIQLAHVMAPDQQCQYKPDGKDLSLRRLLRSRWRRKNGNRCSCYEQHERSRYRRAHQRQQHELKAQWQYCVHQWLQRLLQASKRAR